MIRLTFVTPLAPCPPTHLTVDSSCESNDISVSWQASQGSASYMVMAVDAEEHRWSCNTTSTTCQIFDLPCGQQYHVYAVGVDQNCFGSKSNIEIFRTGIFKPKTYLPLMKLQELDMSFPVTCCCNHFIKSYPSSNLRFSISHACFL